MNEIPNSTKDIFQNLRDSGQFFSIVYINKFNSHTSDWQELARSLSVEQLLNNYAAAVDAGTVDSKAAAAAPWAKESRPLILRGGRVTELLPETAALQLSFEPHLDAGYLNALDLELARFYIKHNAATGSEPHTLQDCIDYAFSKGLIYARAYTNKETGETFQRGDAKSGSCACRSLPYRRFSLAGIVQVTHNKTVTLL